MRKPEQRLWDRMRDNVGSKVRLERVENVVTVGMPDVLALRNRVVTWVELKHVDAYPVRKDTPVLGKQHGLSRDQMNWHLDWRTWGGHSIILVGVERDIYAIDGTMADEVNSFSGWQLMEYASATNWCGLVEILG